MKLLHPRTTLATSRASFPRSRRFGTPLIGYVAPPPVVDGVVRPAGQRGDGVRIRFAGSDIKHLSAVGTLPGVAVLEAAGANRPGIGMLRLTGAGSRIAWRAPRSETFGSTTLIPADGTYIVEDGEDPVRHLRVQVYRDHLPASGELDARVYLADRWNNHLAADDVAAVDAAAGDVETFELGIFVVSPNAVFDVKIWLQDLDDVGRLELSADGVTWSAPWHEGHTDVVRIAQIDSGASQALYVRRTTAAGAASDPDILNVLGVAWDGY